MRVMILSVTAGFGHHATAKAVSDQLQSMGATVETFDIYEYINGAIKETIDKGYLFTSKHTQELYRIGYLLAENGGKGYWASPIPAVRAINRLGASKFLRTIRAFDPDVIVCTGSGSDYELDADLLADKGLFLDLYTYMDKEGETMNRGAFVPCVLQPMETADGTLPLLVQSFSLATLAGKASVLGEKAVWSVDNLLMFTDTLSEGQYLFASYYDTSASTDGTEPAMSLMKALLSYSLSAFVDEKTATCTFNDGRFASLLRFCTEAPILNSSEIDSEAALLRNNTLALTSLDISGFSDYLQVKSYNFENDITLVGYPVSDETAVSGTIVNPERMMGITKDSPVADGAWEFLKRTFGDTDDENYFWRNGFSSAYAALESMFEEESRSYYIFEEYGWSATHFDPEDEIDLSNWEADAEMSGGVCGHFEEEDKQLFLDIFNHATIVANADDTILSMIEEDASAYFSGAKTLEETVDIIQSRVSIYVSETMG